MTDKPAGTASVDEATVVMSKSVPVEPSAAAATVINPAGGGINISVNNSGISQIGSSQRTLAAAVPAPEKPRSIALALATGALTGLALFALTALWLSRGH